MSKYQALIDALAGVDGQLGQPSLHSGHVIYAETEEWCSVDINVKLSANKHISGPLARFIKESANPATIRALLADLERAEKALAALAQQAQVKPFAYMDDDVAAGVLEGSVLLSAAIRGAPGGTFNFPLYTRPQQAQEPVQADAPRSCPDACRTPEKCRNFGCQKATPPAPQVPAPDIDEAAIARMTKRGADAWAGVDAQSVRGGEQVPAPVDERTEFEASMREKHGWEGRDFQSDSFGYFDGHTAAAWLAWQARAALQSPAPQAGGWLPIESAPKDGTRLILWWGGKPVFAGWLDNSQCKHPWAGWQTPSLTPRPQGEPTHYMPPPPAPQTKGQP